MARKPLAKTSERGYTGAHRRGYAFERERQWGKPCARCGREMIRGQVIQKDHLDDRSGYWPTWSHRRCNIAASNKRRAALARAARQAAREATQQPRVYLIGPSERQVRAMRQQSRPW